MESTLKVFDSTLLNLTVCILVKLFPLIITFELIFPLEGEKDVIDGVRQLIPLTISEKDCAFSIVLL